MSTATTLAHHHPVPRVACNCRIRTEARLYFRFTTYTGSTYMVEQTTTRFCYPSGTEGVTYSAIIVRLATDTSPAWVAGIGAMRDGSPCVGRPYRAEQLTTSTVVEADCITLDDFAPVYLAAHGESGQ